MLRAYERTVAEQTARIVFATDRDVMPLTVPSRRRGGLLRPVGRVAKVAGAHFWKSVAASYRHQDAELRRKPYEHNNGARANHHAGCHTRELSRNGKQERYKKGNQGDEYSGDDDGNAFVDTYAGYNATGTGDAVLIRFQWQLAL